MMDDGASVKLIWERMGGWICMLVSKFFHALRSLGLRSLNKKMQGLFFLSLGLNGTFHL